MKVSLKKFKIKASFNVIIDLSYGDLLKKQMINVGELSGKFNKIVLT